MLKNKKQNYNLTLQEVLKKYSASEQGLTELEAKERIKKHGFNEIQKKQNWKWAKIIFAQFNDALVWILLVAAFLAFLFSEYRDVTIILIIVFINASIGFFQEFKAERILDSIKKLTKERAIVIREGEKKEIDAKLVVPGDVISVSSGDNIPADGYILESYELKVNNFIFTGETKPKRKEMGALEESKVALADITNMVFMGETVSIGEAKILVTGTGMNTELGRIADTVQTVVDTPTPLQSQMRVLGRDVTILSVMIGVLVVIGGQYFKMSLYQNFIFALALSVSVVPEGLPAAISVALSLGMKRLLKDNVLAKKLNAVETLGSVSIICTDKTGTITKNELTVTKIFLNDEIINVSGTGYEPRGEFSKDDKVIEIARIPNAEMLFRIGTLCNDATLKKNKKTYSIIGDPTEGAIIVAGQKFNSRKGFFENKEKKITENPFSSERMRMSVVYENDELISYVKGSPDVLLDLCTQIKIGENILPFGQKEKEKIKKVYNAMSQEALRVLAFAYRNLENAKDEPEKDLVWVGMMAMIDPPRADVAQAIADCKNLGMKVIMITGDYEITGRAIAKKAGMISEPASPAGRQELMTSDQENKLVINGKVLDSLSDKEIYRRINNGACVFARIAPEQKLRIATVLKKYGEIIAMTGDGVNDAPALKKADIGVAMGIIGTDVSKEASDMILMDDNFSSIVKGVREGRTIFSNLKKFVHYVFTSNASELFTVIFGVILQIPSPISAVQILAVDLGTDILPSFSLSLEPSEPDSKEEKNSKKRQVMDMAGFRRIIYLGIIMATGATIAFIWSMLRGGWYFGEKIDANALLYIKSTTVAYAIISMTQMANLLQSRSAKLSPFQLGFFKNKYALGAIVISFLTLLIFMYLPFFQKYLRMSPIDWIDWIMVIISMLAVFYWEEIRKAESKN
ncbi:MAG: cation-transporting P-type ATPase [Parcubacteria group bacterium]|jgi:Ca2+-transporting ATPase